MADRLRDLLDLVLDSLDEPEADGPVLARRASFLADHLDRLVAGATGESPVALRRRLLLERAAWQLRVGGVSAAEAASAAGYGSLAAFSRAFSRAHGVTPSACAAGEGAVEVAAPNGIHFHPPAGLLIPGGSGAPSGMDLTERLVRHHLDRLRKLLEATERLPESELERPLRPGFVAVWFDGEEASAAEMAERSVYTLEVWLASLLGEEHPPMRSGPLLDRLDRAGPRFERFARSVRDRGAWDDAFVDALRTAPVLHLRRRACPHPVVGRGTPRDARLRAGRARRRGTDRRGGRPDHVGAAPATLILLGARCSSLHRPSTVSSA